MKTKLFFLIFILLLSATAYSANSSGISSTVVDAETGKPIEGAVVLVQWTREVGIGDYHTETVKVGETITDKEGEFKVSGVLNPFVDPPTIVIYKKGYVAWRNDFIFPDYKKRENFKTENKNMFQLERFKRYSHSRHILFLRGGLSLASTRLEEAYSWEDPLASKEEELAREKRKIKKVGEYKEEELWKEIVEELYFKNGDQQ